MEKIYTITDLENAILNLEIKQDLEKVKLKEQFFYTYESLKPLNILKNILRSASESEDVKGSIINNSIGLTADYISKKIFGKSTNSPLKTIFGNVILFSVKKIVENNTEVVMVLLDRLLAKISRKK